MCVRACRVRACVCRARACAACVRRVRAFTRALHASSRRSMCPDEQGIYDAHLHAVLSHVGFIPRRSPLPKTCLTYVQPSLRSPPPLPRRHTSCTILLLPSQYTIPVKHCNSAHHYIIIVRICFSVHSSTPMQGLLLVLPLPCTHCH